MRKQYHFRKSEVGLKAWDVDRLIELSKTFTVEQVPLSNIRELDESYWFDDNATPTCRDVISHINLINQSDLSYPIILSSDGRIMDGMHRVAKAVLAGHDTIKALRFSIDPKPDYIGVSPEDLPY